jgi:beta-galactosidase
MVHHANLSKNVSTFLLLVGFLIYNNSESQTFAQNRQRLLMDFNWKFLLGDQKDAGQENFDDSKWRTLNLPHDWSIEGEYSKEATTGWSGGYLPTGIGWYRRHFQVSKSDLNKQIWIEFDGVYMNSDVWINGHRVGNYPYGYNSFHYDVTRFITEGENIIAVRVDNSLQPNTRWYTGSGIYRHVWLVMVDPLHIGHWGVFVTTPKVSAESATVDVRTAIENGSGSVKKGTLRTLLTNNAGREVALVETPFSLNPDQRSEISQQLTVVSPKLWSVDAPALYKLHSIVLVEKKRVDEITTTVGIRSIEYDVNKGFFLNGEHLKMNGVCLHHDGGSVGSAVPERIWERRLERLKEMGCNAIRTSHNPPAPEFLDLCDRMGFLVMDEAFDEWNIGKREYGYHLYFDTWAQHDLEAMIRRDRNHPSIVLWSVGNEIPEQTKDNGVEIVRSLMEICHREDPTRPVTSACDNIAADGGATTLAFLKELDIVGYNYVDRWHERRELYYSIDRHDHPDWKMIGTESISNGGLRGEYSMGKDSSAVYADYNFRMINSAQLWKFVGAHEYVIGDFMWTGIDYLGEAFWPYKNASSGVLDLCGFPKDGYYFYQSQWTEKPMIHLFPHWNWAAREGQVIPVLCYTNCDAVELFLNGKSLGEKRIEFPRQGNSGAWNRYDKPLVNPTTADLHIQWDVSYALGVLRAVGKKAGKIACVQEMRTAGKPAAIKLSVDRDTVSADARDVAHVEVRILDVDGNIVPTADNLITFIIEGEGKLIGVDNGNPRDHDSYKINRRHAFNGMCLAVVQSTVKSGKIKLNAKGDGLAEAVVEISVRKGNAIPFLQ